MDVLAACLLIEMSGDSTTLIDFANQKFCVLLLLCTG